MGGNPPGWAYPGQYEARTPAHVTADSAVSETLTLTTAGVRTRFGASALSEILSFVTAAVRTVFGSSDLSEALTFTTSGTVGPVNPLVFSPATVGTLTRPARGNLEPLGVGQLASVMLGPLASSATGKIGADADPAALTGQIPQTIEGRLTKASHT